MPVDSRVGIQGGTQSMGTDRRSVSVKDFLNVVTVKLNREDYRIFVLDGGISGFYGGLYCMCWSN